MSIIMQERVRGCEIEARIRTEVAHLEPEQLYTIILQSTNEEIETSSSQGRWVKAAAQFVQQGALSHDAAEYLRQFIREFRDNFEFMNEEK